MTLYDLRGKNIYVGNQEVLKGYLGNNLLFNSVGLVFPEPPTDFDTRSLKWAYFFGSGEIINYYGEGIIDELNVGVIKENGLYLEEPINFHDFSEPGGTVTLDMTLERPNDIIDSLQPGQSVIIIKSRLNRGYEVSAFVGKDSDGIVRVGAKTFSSIFVEDINAASPIGDAEYIHITYSNAGSNRSFASRWSYGYSVNINGVAVAAEFNSTRTGAQSFKYAEISKDILLYDLKIYQGSFTTSEFDTFATTNYNGIKDLTFVRTDQL